MKTHENISGDKDSNEAPAGLLRLAGELRHNLGFHCRSTQSECSGRTAQLGSGGLFGVGGKQRSARLHLAATLPSVSAACLKFTCLSECPDTLRARLCQLCRGAGEQVVGCCGRRPLCHREAVAIASSPAAIGTARCGFPLHFHICFSPPPQLCPTSAAQQDASSGASVWKAR